MPPDIASVLFMKDADARAENTVRHQPALAWFVRKEPVGLVGGRLLRWLFTKMLL